MFNEILQQILNELKTIKADIKDLKEGQINLEKGQQRIDKKLDAVYDQLPTPPNFAPKQI